MNEKFGKNYYCLYRASLWVKLNEAVNIRVQIENNRTNKLQFPIKYYHLFHIVSVLVSIKDKYPCLFGTKHALITKRIKAYFEQNINYLRNEGLF